ncbi:hypothetical protein C772_01241 [Bhargavaea cecembensis DSE10]|uniref:Uncharacterized protein n=1 Tax=Bhargavaea cecembensis DSE10 TaxID=1235279 RepID=M7NDT0_9BACL|nr:hypothetical protein C772_01241 [Bhargavaea cecembensis DSE10]
MQLQPKRDWGAAFGRLFLFSLKLHKHLLALMFITCYDSLMNKTCIL